LTVFVNYIIVLGRENHFSREYDGA